MPRKVAEKTVFYSNWMQIVEATIESENGAQSPYFYQRYPWSDSRGVAILCYRDIVEDGETFREYLGRYEYLPAQGEGLTLCSITGAYDHKGESFHQCAIRELEEEGGYTTTVGSLKALGTARNSKSSDNVMYLFAVNVDDCKAVEAIGDGSIAEEGSYVEWIGEIQATFCEDVLLPTMVARLNLLTNK